jgi:hypothetical protein
MLHKKSVPKTGAALAYNDSGVYLLKGNNTREMWQYVLTAAKSEERRPNSIFVGQGFSPASSENHNSPTHQLTINPNPFTNLTTIRYNVTTSSKVSIKLFNSTGKLVSTLVDEYKPVGSYTFELNREIPQGVYFLKYNNGVNTSETKLIVQ